MVIAVQIIQEKLRKGCFIHFSLDFLQIDRRYISIFEGTSGKSIIKTALTKRSNENDLILLIHSNFHFQLRTPFNFVLMNLIVTEFIMMTFGLPFDIMASYHQGWKLGYSSCLFLGLSQISKQMFARILFVQKMIMIMIQSFNPEQKISLLK